MPSDAQLRAAVQETRKAFEASFRRPPGGMTTGRDYYSPYHKALVAAAHLGPDPVEEAFERYREAVIAYEARERTGQAIYWGHMEPIIAARRALDAAILGEVTGE